MFLEAQAGSLLNPVRETTDAHNSDSQLLFSFDKVEGGPFRPPDEACEKTTEERMISLLGELAKGERSGLSKHEREVLTILLRNLDDDDGGEDQFNLRIIGAALNLTESRVCQIVDTIGRKVRVNYAYE